MVDREGARLRRDVAWNLIPVVLLAGVGLGLNLVIGHGWGAAALGAFGLVTTAFFSLAVAGAAGLQYAVLRAIAEDPDDRTRASAIVVGALVPNVVFAATAAALCALLSGPVGRLVGSSLVTDGMLWVAPGVFCFAINKVLLGVVNGLRRMRAFAAYTSLRYILIAIGLGLASAIDLPGDHLAVIWTLTEGALLVVLLVELLATIPLRRCAGWITWARRNVDFGARGLLATIVFEVNSKLDVWMLGIALPDGPVGIYALASSLYEGATQLSVVVQNNLNPIIAHELSEGRPQAVDALVRRTRKWFVPAVIGASVIAIVAYPMIIPTIVGETFRDGGMPFAILMVGFALTSAWSPFNQLLLMGARPGWHTVFITSVFAIAFVANQLLIPSFGLEGAALATLTATVAAAVLLRALGRWQTKVRI